ncbi:MAG: response regulator [bacterium]|jgi:DNA-binding NarL/FixJ family response regulator
MAKVMTGMKKSFGSKIRIIVVDDHPIVCRGLCDLINEEPDLEVIAEAADADEALQQIELNEPDLVIVDLMLKGTSGIELIKQIRSRFKNIKMLVSSIHDETIYAERALRAGATGYVNKQVATQNIISAIHTVMSGKVYLSDQQSNWMLNQFVDVNQKPENFYINSLSDRELEIFERFGRGMSTRQIADKLNLSVKTVETHRENIKKKLNLENGNELIRCAVHWVLEQG